MRRWRATYYGTIACITKAGQPSRCEELNLPVHMYVNAYYMGPPWSLLQMRHFCKPISRFLQALPLLHNAAWDDVSKLKYPRVHDLKHFFY